MNYPETIFRGMKRNFLVFRYKHRSRYASLSPLSPQVMRTLRFRNLSLSNKMINLNTRRPIDDMEQTDSDQYVTHCTLGFGRSGIDPDSSMAVVRTLRT